MKDAVIAKLANQAADYYGDAFKQCQYKDNLPKVCEGHTHTLTSTVLGRCTQSLDSVWCVFSVWMCVLYVCIPGKYAWRLSKLLSSHWSIFTLITLLLSCRLICSLPSDHGHNYFLSVFILWLIHIMRLIKTAICILHRLFVSSDSV